MRSDAPLPRLVALPPGIAREDRVHFEHQPLELRLELVDRRALVHLLSLSSYIRSLPRVSWGPIGMEPRRRPLSKGNRAEVSNRHLPRSSRLSCRREIP